MFISPLTRWYSVLPMPGTFKINAAGITILRRYGCAPEGPARVVASTAGAGLLPLGSPRVP